MNALPVYANRYIKTKIRTNANQINFSGLNVPKDGIEFESFTIISIYLLHVCDNKYYLEVYLDICVYKIVNTKTKDYLDDNLFESDKI